MQAFIAELRRRNVLRVGAFYAAAGWLLVQVATQVFPFFDIPNWLVRVVVLAIVLGFVPALLFSWFYELTPQGIKLESEVARDASITRFTGRKLDRWIIVVLGLAVVLLLADRLVIRRGAVGETADTASEKSIAVLPFTDLSPAHDQEYFSDGMAEELLNALAKVKDLKVAGRTSSFSFKGRNEDLREIGRTLGVANLLEGSVRKQGDKVRITAQLIRASDGYHRWSEAYDGELTDVFDLQERIARAITQQLQVIMEDQQRLVPVATTNPDAYTLYLQASAIFNRRDGVRFADAIADLQEAIRLDPAFARAHARLASVYSVAADWTAMDMRTTLPAAEHEAQAAIAQDPSLAEPQAALGEAYAARRQLLSARAAMEKAVALDPADLTSNYWLGELLMESGYRAQGEARWDQVLAVDPLAPLPLFFRGEEYRYAGDLKNAQRLLQRAADNGAVIADRGLAFIAHAQGRDAEAIDRLARGQRPQLAGLPEDTGRVLAEGIFGDATARARALAMIEHYLAGKPAVVSGSMPWALLLLGEPARALEAAAEPTSNDGPFFFLLWSPEGAAARKLPQFPEFARKLGWTEVWDKYGAPEGCRRVDAGSYVCG